MVPLIFVTLGLILISSIVDFKKTIKGVRKGLTMFLNLFPALLIMLALVSIVFYLVPNETIARLIGKDSGLTGWVISVGLGSISLIPGFIAYPLCGILIKSGVAYSTIAVFITTQMMVGVVTLPIEAKFFGWRISIIRNALSFIAALLVGTLMMFLL